MRWEIDITPSLPDGCDGHTSKIMQALTNVYESGNQWSIMTFSRDAAGPPAVYTFRMEFDEAPLIYEQELTFDGPQVYLPSFSFPAWSGWTTVRVDLVRKVIVAVIEMYASHQNTTNITVEYTP